MLQDYNRCVTLSKNKSTESEIVSKISKLARGFKAKHTLIKDVFEDEKRVAEDLIKYEYVNLRKGDKLILNKNT